MPVTSFLSQAARLFNARQTRVLVLSGNVHDLFPQDGQQGYLPLPELVAGHWSLPDRMVLTYELNGPIRFQNPDDKQLLKDAWTRWRTGLDAGDLALQRLAMSSRDRAALDRQAQDFDTHLGSAIGRPTVALELLRQFCICSRQERDGHPLLSRDLVLIIEAADLILPEAPVTGLGDADRQRLHICHDWFSDPAFLDGDDVVVLLAESTSNLHQRIIRLPQVLDLPIEAPDAADRARFIDWYQQAHDRRDGELPDQEDASTAIDCQALAQATAGLSLQALRQLLAGARHAGAAPSREAIIAKIEEHITTQLGPETVSFKKPTHRLDAVVGNGRLKTFLQEEFIPRLRAGGESCIPGAAVGGPIGAGKTFIFEAVAAELDVPVLELKNIRSQWFGQTDAIIERLRRVLESLDRVLIIVDEADTQFGGLHANEHSTERRLTGKIQAMMSDPALVGRVYWLLMTARIHLLSPDIRRPGRVGDLIIPVLDPSEPADERAFIRWMVAKVTDAPDEALVEAVRELTPGWSAAAYASLRRELNALAAAGPIDAMAIKHRIADHLQPAIAQTRRYQTLQALVNCTRRSLLPDPSVSDSQRAAWESELKELEARGIN